MSKASGVSTSRVVSIDDLRELAKRRLPRVVFDYVDGGAGGEVTLRGNRAAFDLVTFRPRHAVVVPTAICAAAYWDSIFFSCSASARRLQPRHASGRRNRRFSRSHYFFTRMHQPTVRNRREHEGQPKVGSKHLSVQVNLRERYGLPWPKQD